MFTMLRAVVLLAVLGSSGCASLSRNECSSGDWLGIGMRDGANGHAEDRFVDHAAACVAHGINADREQWLLGREQGLERYCTARHAYNVGASRSNYAGVCAGRAEQDFLHGYRLGGEMAAARDRREHWDHEIHHLRKQLDADPKKQPPEGEAPRRLSDSERVEIAYLLGVALSRRDEASRDMEEINLLSQRL